MGGSREGKDEAPSDRRGVRMRDGSQRGKAEGPCGDLHYLGGGGFKAASERATSPPMPGDPARCFSHRQETPGLKRRDRAVCKPTGCSREVKVDHQVTRDTEPWAGG